MAQDPRAFVAVIIILFMIFSPDPQPPNIPQKSRVDDVLAQETYALNITNSTSFGDFAPLDNKWINISGLTNETGFGWTYLKEFHTKGEHLTRGALGDQYANKFVGQPVGHPLALYNNVSGVVHGKWKREDGSLAEQPPRFNMSVYAPDGPFGAVPVNSFNRNLTAKEGAVRVRFEEFDRPFLNETRHTMDGQAVEVGRFVTAQIGIDSTDGSNESWEVQVNGVHFLESGHMVLTTTSEKLAGIFALPHFVQTPYYYQIAQHIATRAINETIARQTDGRQRLSSPFTSNTDGSSDTQFTMPHCELIVYLQQLPIMAPSISEDGEESSLLHLLEDELRFPTGAAVPQSQEMRFSMVAFSPDCGYAIESKGPPDNAIQEGNHLSGIKIEVEQQQARHHILFYICVLSGQLWLLTRQMKEASTPSMRSRISFYTVSMLSLGDGFTTMTFALISLFIPGLWVLLIATCFLAFLSVSFFGMRFLMDIWTVQAPERERRERERRATAAATNPTVAANPINPAPVAVPAPAAPPRAQQPPTQQAAVSPPTTTRPDRTLDGGPIPIIIGSDQDEPIESPPSPTLGLPAPATANTPTAMTAAERTYSFGALYSRFYFLLLATLFLSLNATSWPPTLRRFYFTLLAFSYLSFWVPQIFRNAVRNCRRALRWEFVIGQSLLRLSPFAYFYGYGANVLFADVDMIDLSVLAGWLWIQCVVLASQEILGPRWFVKGDWVPPAYDYHPVLRQDEEGGNLPVGNDDAPASPSLGSKPKDVHDESKRVFDCAICMQDIEVHVQGLQSAPEGGLAGAGGLLARRAYMLTPCRHIFHAKCLEGWMKFRLQCPICREDLPPM
ncbi:hypothetical protein B9Z65_6857 [Elsinoe australis]|uniref:DSC E3 ubiquitin ligase complex subunit A n=1 Tax=Elsinoe australis TaxID=40998 RepID=A0A2P7Z3X4_9PEZI|nr:hypothetical protein B9Z65_6857 [Elsinoe australis]